MKAKLVREDQNFERGLNPRTTLNIGMAARAKEILDWHIRDNRRKYHKYHINSIDEILIYGDYCIGSKYDDPVWKLDSTIAYIEIDRYYFRSSYEYEKMTCIILDREDDIKMLDPFSLHLHVKSLGFDPLRGVPYATIHQLNLREKESEVVERAKIITDILNGQTPKIGKFILVKDHTEEKNR